MTRIREDGRTDGRRVRSHRSAREGAPIGSISDVPGIRVGHWTDRRAITGCSVVLPDRPVIAGVDVRGAAPGTRETDLLRPGNLVQHAHAIVLAGGSAFGLEAASGVTRFLAERGIGFTFGGAVVPIVPAAIVYDLGIGRHDRWPGMDTGHRAASNASSRVEEGSVGAGTGATVGKARGPEHGMKGGIGTASERSAGDAIIAGALAVVNASGDVIDSATGATIAGARGDDGRIEDTTEVLREGRLWQPELAGTNTVLVVVATNAALTKEQANRLATVCHDGIARAVRPAHTQSDGDVVFAIATGDREMDAGGYRVVEALGALATERAIVRGVLTAVSLGGYPSATDVPAGRTTDGRRRRR